MESSSSRFKPVSLELAITATQKEVASEGLLLLDISIAHSIEDDLLPTAATMLIDGDFAAAVWDDFFAEHSLAPLELVPLVS
jgi:hypothetical protein